MEFYVRIVLINYLRSLGKKAVVSLKVIKNHNFDKRQKHFCGFALDF
jgi:hypothetical protein